MLLPVDDQRMYGWFMGVSKMVNRWLMNDGKDGIWAVAKDRCAGVYACYG